MVLLLDMDDTLIDSQKAYRASLSAVGIDPAGIDYLEARRTVKERLGEGHVCARNRLLYFKARAERLSRSTPAGVLQLMEHYERALETEIGRQWRVLGRDRLLTALTSEHPAAIITNENVRTQLLKLRAIDPDGRFFRWVITSEEIGAEKPATRAFEEALRRIGCEARDCVSVGDSLAMDILPALQLGMRAIVSREFSRDQGELPPGVASLERLDDLPAVLGG
jgi:putative hydrolase of the HAD superfamily